MTATPQPESSSASSAIASDTTALKTLKRELSLFLPAAQNVPERSTSSMGSPGYGTLSTISSRECSVLGWFSSMPP